MAILYKPVTILTEDDLGRIGSEEHKELTLCQIISRCRVLSAQGWEPIEIQVDDSQRALAVDWYRRPESE